MGGATARSVHHGRLMEIEFKFHIPPDRLKAVDAALRRGAVVRTRLQARYFDTAAAHHHEDEEADLFPALIESMAGSDAGCLHALVQGLVAEHRRLADLWAPLRTLLSEIAAGQPAVLPPSQVQAFTEAYAAHIQREEDELLPMAARLISDDALADIGQAMKARRGGGAS